MSYNDCFSLWLVVLRDVLMMMMMMMMMMNHDICADNTTTIIISSVVAVVAFVAFISVFQFARYVLTFISIFPRNAVRNIVYRGNYVYRSVCLSVYFRF